MILYVDIIPGWSNNAVKKLVVKILCERFAKTDVQ